MKALKYVIIMRSRKLRWVWNKFQNIQNTTGYSWDETRVYNNIKNEDTKICHYNEKQKAEVGVE
jgi:hypothetical protein